MWSFSQSTGQLKDDKASLVATGYSGKGECKNRPETQARPFEGPLPRGFYEIGEPHDSPHTGKFTLLLEPYPENEMYGRGDFKIHGDKMDDPGNASEGCIVIPLWARQKVHQSGDKILEVTH